MGTRGWRWLAAVFLGGLWVLGGVTAATAQVNYPLSPTIELFDSNGNAVNAIRGVCPADGIAVASSGWKPDSNIDATFRSDPVSIGTHRTDAGGVVRFLFRLAEVPNGIHTVQLDGTGTDGQPRMVQAAVLCDCEKPPVTTTTTAVPGSATTTSAPGSATTTTLAPGGGGSNNNSSSSSNSGALGTVVNRGLFARTGLNIGTLIGIALTLVAAGLALFVAAKRNRWRHAR